MLDNDTVYERPNIGEVVDQLPSKVKSVIINGKKLYVTPDNVYYEAFVEDDEVRYTVNTSPVGEVLRTPGMVARKT